MGTGFLSGWRKCSGIEEWWWYMLCIHLLGIIKKLVVIDSYLDIKILIVTPKPKGIYISMHMSSKLFNFPQENLIFFSDLGPQICFNSWHLHTAFSLNKPFHPIYRRNISTRREGFFFSHFSSKQDCTIFMFNLLIGNFLFWGKSAS